MSYMLDIDLHPIISLFQLTTKSVPVTLPPLHSEFDAGNCVAAQNSEHELERHVYLGLESSLATGILHHLYDRDRFQPDLKIACQ